MRERPVERWGIRWHEYKSPQYLMWNGVCPHLFRTRAEARAFIQERYGYIKHRPDLRRAPHNWRLPRPVRVLVRVEEAP